MGLASFSRRAIKNFSTLSPDLNKLVRKDSGYTKGPLPSSAEHSLRKLQKALTSKPCLAALDFDKEFILTCDASATHCKACLSQVDNKGIEQPCAYASKLLSVKESKQAPGLRERVFALRHFNPYLVGKEFVLRTDHKPNLAIIKGKTNVYDTLTDEINKIMSYLPFRMEYLNGKKCLSTYSHDRQVFKPAMFGTNRIITIC